MRWVKNLDVGVYLNSIFFVFYAFKNEENKIIPQIIEVWNENGGEGN
jgi:hypothetical protein